MAIGSASVVDYANVTSGSAFGVVANGKMGGASVIVRPRELQLFLLDPLLFSATPTVGIDKTATFARTSVNTVYGYIEADNAGAVQRLLTIPAGIPRFSGARFIASTNAWSQFFADGTPISASDFEGSLLEDGIRNQLPNSEDFSAWTNVATGIATNTTVAPDGNQTADSLTFTGAAGTNFILELFSNYPAVTGQAVTFSLFTKTSTRLILFGGASPTGSSDYSVETLRSGWFRQYMTRVFTQTISTKPLQCLIANDIASPGTYPVWGAMMNVGTYARSYNSTGATFFDSSSDVLSYPATNIQTTEASIYLEFQPEHAPSGAIFLFGSYVDANNYTAILHDGTNLIMRKRISGVNHDATKALAFVAETIYKIAVSYGTSGIILVINGVAGTSDATTTAAQLGTTIQIGADGNGAGQPYAQIKNVKIFRYQVPVNELVAMTA